MELLVDAFGVSPFSFEIQTEPEELENEMQAPWPFEDAAPIPFDVRLFTEDEATPRTLFAPLRLAATNRVEFE